jgi:hypothetical protein
MSAELQKRRPVMSDAKYNEKWELEQITKIVNESKRVLGPDEIAERFEATTGFSMTAGRVIEIIDGSATDQILTFPPTEVSDDPMSLVCGRCGKPGESAVEKREGGDTYRYCHCGASFFLRQEHYTKDKQKRQALYHKWSEHRPTIKAALEECARSDAPSVLRKIQRREPILWPILSSIDRACSSAGTDEGLHWRDIYLSELLRTIGRDSGAENLPAGPDH